MSTAETPRTRTFHWRDPGEAVSDARVMTGLDWLRSIIFDGDHLEAAPIAECLGFRLTKADPGRAVFELVVGEQHYNPIGTVHGGVLATLCDSAAGAAVHSTLAVGERYTTLEIKVSFLRAVTVESGRLRCEGTVISRGSKVATAQAHLYDASDKLCAHATSTCLVLAAPQPK